MTTLFDPLELRDLTLANRVVVSPMCQYSAIDGSAQAWHHVHLGQLAESSAGLLIIEATAVEAIGRITPGCLGLYSDENEAALASVLSTIRALLPDATIPLCVQLAHAGRKASSLRPWEGGAEIPIADGGWQTVAPSTLPHLDGEDAPEALDRAGMERIRDAFVASARRAERLGFDALELHAAHGYLLHEFLSPIANRREDEYGGSLENRMRYPLEIVHAVREVWPAGKPIGVRLSATDFDPASSWTIEESALFAKACEAVGADWIDVSGGGASANQQIPTGPGYQVPYAARIRETVSIPVIAVGLITDPVQANTIIHTGQADLVALARAFLYNPRWVWHAAAALGGTVNAPRQYWRSEPRQARGIFGETKTGQR